MMILATKIFVFYEIYFLSIAKKVGHIIQV